MNVAAASTPALPGPTRPEVVGTGHIVPTTAAGAESADAGVPAAFGHLLSQHLTQGGEAATDAAPTATDGAVGVAVDPAAVAAAVDGATAALLPAGDGAGDLGAVVLQDLQPTVAGAKAATTGPDAPADARSDPRTDDAAGTDAAGELAAQLALVAQWTALAQPVVPAAPTPGATATAGGITASTAAPGRVARDGADVKGRLEAVRSGAAAVGGAAAGAADPATATAAGIVTSAAATNDAATLAALPPAPGSGVPTGAAARPDQPEHDAVTTAAAAAALAPQAGAANAAALAAADALAATKSGATDARGAGETAALGDAFLTRLAAHLSAAGPVVAPPATVAAAPVPSAFLHEPVGTPAWSHDVGQAALRMVANDLQTAQLHLNPEHLGPMEVQVRVDNGVAHVAFNATHADTRQALEASRTTLDQMFSAQGIRIGDVSVGGSGADPSNARAFDFGGAQADASGRRGGGTRWSGGEAGGDTEPVGTVSARISRALGLVDTFA